MGFLIPHDAEINLSEKPKASEYYRDCVGMDELKRAASLVPARHILFIVDACYAGLALKSFRAYEATVPGYLKKVASVPSQQVMTAGGEGEESVERPEFGHGIFTYKLLEGLDTGIADWDDDGVITGSELGNHLKMTVPKMTNGEQTPLFRVEGEGEFLFLPQVGGEPEETEAVEEPGKPTSAPAASQPPAATKLPAGLQPFTSLRPQTSAEEGEDSSKDDAPRVFIPAGEFQMGDEKAPHTVYLDAFYMDKYEVTNALYKSFMDATGHEAPAYWSDSNFNGLDHPVVGVSWDDAVAYCQWAGKRLPTEAEWEKAARGGLAGNTYPGGNDITRDDANYFSKGGGDKWLNSAPVGSFAPNGYGLCDMAGNVWEWCADWHGSTYYSESPKQNPKGPISGANRVLRGGSHGLNREYMRVAKRYSRNPKSKWYNDVGFRCAKDAMP